MRLLSKVPIIRSKGLYYWQNSEQSKSDNQDIVERNIKHLGCCAVGGYMYYNTHNS